MPIQKHHTTMTMQKCTYEICKRKERDKKKKGRVIDNREKNPHVCCQTKETQKRNYDPSSIIRQGRPNFVSLASGNMEKSRIVVPRCFAEYS